MKKLMILGASYSQLPLYKTAKKLGIATVAVSTPGDWPCFDIADECSYTDISDPEAVLKSAREHSIDGITTCCLDAGIRSIGYVCERMGVKGLSAQSGSLCGDKYYMKEAFIKGGVSCAKHICIHNREELEAALDQLKFPVILKAVDLMGTFPVRDSGGSFCPLSGYHGSYKQGLLSGGGVYPGQDAWL